MKYTKYKIALIVIVTILISGCLNLNEEQIVEVQRRVGDENIYEDFRTITHELQVQRVIEILNNINWEDKKVEKASPADYSFGFQFKNPDIEAKSVSYELWISPNKDKVELKIDAESKYFQLNEENSADLFITLTGRKLTDIRNY